MEIKGNKGEWSELIVLLKLLVDKKLFIFNKELKLDKERYIKIDKIYKKNKNKEICFVIKNKEVLVIENNIIYKIKQEDLILFYNDILKSVIKTKQHSFKLPQGEEVFKKLKLACLAGGKGEKNDLNIVFNNSFFEKSNKYGFNIKSYLGASPSLLNASQSTNLIFKIKNWKNVDIQSTKSLKIKNKIQYICGCGGDLVFDGFENDIFLKNIIKIDRDLINILPAVVKGYYMSKGVSVKDLEDYIVQKIDKNFLTKEDIIYKTKNFLVVVALGLTPKTKWEGFLQGKGGYIILTKNKELGGLSFYDRDVFMDFLYYNTKLDTPSLKKHKFGEIYKEGDDYKIKLNMQIRFLE